MRVCIRRPHCLMPVLTYHLKVKSIKKKKKSPSNPMRWQTFDILDQLWKYFLISCGFCSSPPQLSCEISFKDILRGILVTGISHFIHKKRRYWISSIIQKVTWNSIFLELHKRTKKSKKVLDVKGVLKRFFYF
jgi:hypothetical protein